MTVDRYTKAMLTVIAICLVWLSLGGPALLAAVAAQATNPAGIERVYLAGWVDANGVTRTLSAFPNQGLPVWQLNP